MENVFLKLLNMSITASWLVLAVVVLRLLLKKAPKWINTVLWAFVGFRLVCPFSFESIFSLIPSTETVPADIVYSSSPAIHSGIPALNSTLNPIISQAFAPDVTYSANPLQIITAVASVIWIIGIVAMILYAVISYARLNKKVREGVVLNDNIWLCDRIDTPFILGIFRPHIFLPSSMNEADMEYVIAHEKAHLKRNDHWWKPIGFLLLTVYWFNPVMWFAYILLCRDIELACDEKVIKEMGTEIKKPYSEALINCSVPRKSIAACPLAFGETGVKGRIKAVLNYKKPAFWVILIAVVSCIVVAVCFLTNPVGSNGIVERIVNENGYTITNQEKIEVTLSIPKASLPESIYSEEGYEFTNDEVIAYKDDVTTIFLKQVRFSNEGNTNLYFCFDFSYDAPKNSGKLISPLGVGEKSSFVLSNSFVLSKKDKTMRDQNTVYEDAVQVRGQGDNNLIWFYVSTDALRQAEGTISFDIYLNRLTYLKGKENKLDNAVSQAIFDINEVTQDILEFKSGNYPKYECATEGHIIYGVEEEGDNVTVYLQEKISRFGFKNGYFMEQSGSITPAVYTFVKNDNGYTLINYEYPVDGELFYKSIQELFPPAYAYRAFNVTEKDHKNLWKQCVKYAEDYLDSIGRKAEIRDYSEVSHIMLTDAGVSVDVEEGILANKSFSHYDLDIGNYETLEDGVRYVYRTNYEKDKNLIVFTKELYGEGENATNQIIEKIEINGQTGDIVSQNSYPYELPEGTPAAMPETYKEYSSDYLDYTKAADEIRNEYSIMAVHCPSDGAVESSILIGESYGVKVADFLDNVKWKKSTAPLSSLSSPGSVEFVIDEDYRITVHKRKSGSLFAYAVVKVNDEERYYHASYDDYEKAVAILHTPENITAASPVKWTYSPMLSATFHSFFYINFDFDYTYVYTTCKNGQMWNPDVEGQPKDTSLRFEKGEHVCWTPDEADTKQVPYNAEMNFTVYNGKEPLYYGSIVFYCVERKSGSATYEVYLQDSNGLILLQKDMGAYLIEAENTATNGGVNKSEDYSEIPELVVTHENEGIFAWTGTATWTFPMNNGKAQTINADGHHALDRMDDINKYYTINIDDRAETSSIVKLNFDIVPDSTKVNSWLITENGNIKAFSPEIDGLNIIHKNKNETCLYEVVAEWNSSDKYSGKIHYAFCVKSEQLDISLLREKYPQFFDLSTDGGLTVYIWQMAKYNYSCYLMNSSMDALTDMSFAFTEGASISEMRAILSTYDIDRNDVTVRPCSNPISSYLYIIDDTYIKKLEELFWS